MAKILVVDDESKVRTILKIMLSSKGHEIWEGCDGNEALSILETEPIDLVITDIRMDGLDGKGLLLEIKRKDMGCPVVFITAFATLESAVDALRLGAADYLVKPFEEKQVHLTVERAIGVGRILTENIRLKKAITQEEAQDAGIFVSPPMLAVREMAERVAPSEATILITGESGTGKEIVARYIHRKSNRKQARFVAVNCAAISPGLIESELFGHEKGAFTGANQKKEGKFEFANNGTLFLDEVGDLSLEAQAKLLRVIQERSFQRVGGNVDIPVNTRLIWATNQNLEHMVEQNSFRRDLFYRISVFPIQVPPLRERKKGIEPLSIHFIKKYATKIGKLSGEYLTRGAVRVLTDYLWPGNVRELANAIERAMILKAGKLPLVSDDFWFLQSDKRTSDTDNSLFKLPATGINFEELQRDLIRQSLEITYGNQSAAARFLGLTRARFRTLLKMEESD